MLVHEFPQEFIGVFSLFSNLKEEQLEYPTDLLMARKDAFLRYGVSIRDSNILKQELP